MIPAPPGFGSIITGMTYGLNLALRRIDPANTGAISQTPGAIWDALWFRFLVTLLNGALILGLGNVSAIVLLGLLALVDALSFPVISQVVIARLGLMPRFVPFILSLTWVGNLRIVVLMTVMLAFGPISAVGMGPGNIILLAVALWLIWATWSAATLSLGRSGWLGAAMVVLMMAVEMINGMLIVTFIHPMLGVS
ncbi:hypothetical protein AB8880_10305 [Alphaproteobacteria bacterium LSUCC0684]